MGAEFERSRGAVVPWIPAMVGVGIMIGLLVAILAWRPDDQPVTAPPPAPPASPASPAGLPPPIEASQGVGSGPPSPTRAATSAPPGPKPKPPPADDGVAGRYQVESSFGDSFIAKVLVTNASAVAKSWTVRLVFGDNVGELRTFWVDGVPQPTLRRNGQTYTFTGTVPIAPRSSLALKFDYSRSGRNNAPESCTTNGVTCRKG